jgi:rhodanese-related sulfurtransferase
LIEPISIEAFRALFDGDEEFAVIDPREATVFSANHLLAATSLPLSRLQSLITAAVPRQETLCVLCDAGGGEAGSAAELLQTLGYTRLAVLDGGIGAWEACGGNRRIHRKVLCHAGDDRGRTASSAAA